METCLGMSFKTHTPVPYWLSRPLGELFMWVDVCISMKGGGGRGKR